MSTTAFSKNQTYLTSMLEWNLKPTQQTLTKQVKTKMALALKRTSQANKNPILQPHRGAGKLYMISQWSEEGFVYQK